MVASHQWTWSRRISLLLALGIVFAAWNAISDERPAADAPHKIPVALLDVAKVFKNCREFNDKMNQMKTEIDQFDREMRKRAEEMQKLAPNDTGSAPSSSVKNEQLENLKEAFKTDVAAKKQVFLVEEARVYAAIYAKIEDAVAKISRMRDVGLVLRFTSDPIDPADRPSVLQGVNKPVVYSAIPDLTTDVLAALNGEKL